MHTKDQIIRRCCDEKMKVVLDMMEIYAREDLAPLLKSVYRDDEGQELLEPEEILQRALREGKTPFELCAKNTLRSLGILQQHQVCHMICFHLVFQLPNSQ